MMQRRFREALFSICSTVGSCDFSALESAIDRTDNPDLFASLYILQK